MRHMPSYLAWTNALFLAFLSVLTLIYHLPIGIVLGYAAGVVLIWTIYGYFAAKRGR